MSIADPIIKIGFRTKGFGAGELDYSINVTKLEKLSKDDFELIKKFLQTEIPESVSFEWAEKGHNV